MSNPAKTPEAVQRAIAEHAAVSEFVRNLDATVAIWQATDPGVKVNAIRAFLQQHVTEHFAFEDEMVFPGLLISNPDPGTLRIVHGLQNDHQAIHQEVKKLNELLVQVEHDGDAERMRQVEMIFRMLLGRLQRHAAEEDKLFATLAAKRR